MLGDESNALAARDVIQTWEKIATCNFFPYHRGIGMPLEDLCRSISSSRHGEVRVQVWWACMSQILTLETKEVMTMMVVDRWAIICG